MDNPFTYGFDSIRISRKFEVLESGKYVNKHFQALLGVGIGTIDVDKFKTTYKEKLDNLFRKAGLPPKRGIYKACDLRRIFVPKGINAVEELFVALAPYVGTVEICYSYFLGRNEEYLFSWEQIPGNETTRLINLLNKNIEHVYLFSWDDIQENVNEKFTEYVKQKLGAGQVLLEKPDNKLITVSANNKFIFLRLNDEKTAVNVEIDGEIIDKLITKTEKDKLNIYEKFKKLSVEQPIRSSADFGKTSEQQRTIFSKTSAGTERMEPWKIEKSKYGSTISVSTATHKVSLQLNYAKTKALLKIDECEYDWFDVELEDGKLNVYNRKTEPLKIGVYWADPLEFKHLDGIEFLDVIEPAFPALSAWAVIRSRKSCGHPKILVDSFSIKPCDAWSEISAYNSFHILPKGDQCNHLISCADIFAAAINERLGLKSAKLNQTEIPLCLPELKGKCSTTFIGDKWLWYIKPSHNFNVDISAKLAHPIVFIFKTANPFSSKNLLEQSALYGLALDFASKSSGSVKFFEESDLSIIRDDDFLLCHDDESEKKINYLLNSLECKGKKIKADDLKHA